MTVSVLVVDDEPDLEVLFRQQFRRELRARRPDVPVIMITAYGDAETRKTALERGAQALLTKPIDFGQVRQAIEARLEQAAC